LSSRKIVAYFDDENIEQVKSLIIAPNDCGLIRRPVQRQSYFVGVDVQEPAVRVHTAETSDEFL
jgi:hypothetical protein